MAVETMVRAPAGSQVEPSSKPNAYQGPWIRIGD